jgi:hypothetical protein
MGRIVPTHSAFWKRNDSLVTHSSSRNASQLSIRLVERNGAFNVAGRVEDTNFTGPEARASFRIVDGLALL